MKSLLRPVFESIKPAFGSSFLYKRFGENFSNPNDSVWHYHPELEIVYVNRSGGQRQIGSHLSHYKHGDLVLIGSNLPHCGFAGKLKEGQRETVIQWNNDVFGKTFFDVPEMRNVKALFEKALNGIIFHEEDKRKIGAKIEAMEHLNNYQRMLALLEVFGLMAASENYTILNAGGFLLETKVEDQQRINLVFNFVKENFNEEISLDNISHYINMTASSFCKYFKKITGKTFVQFLTEYRLVYAAKLLYESNMGVSEICYESGFNNYSHFTKKFKEHFKKTPLNYRNEIKVAISNTIEHSVY